MDIAEFIVYLVIDEEKRMTRAKRKLLVMINWLTREDFEMKPGNKWSCWVPRGWCICCDIVEACAGCRMQWNSNDDITTSYL